MRHARTFLIAFALTTLGIVLVLGPLVYAAWQHEMRRVEAERNLYNEFVTQPPVGCVENPDGSATCRDETGGWHFEHSPWGR